MSIFYPKDCDFDSVPDQDRDQQFQSELISLSWYSSGPNPVSLNRYVFKFSTKQ